MADKFTKYFLITLLQLYKILCFYAFWTAYEFQIKI